MTSRILREVSAAYSGAGIDDESHTVSCMRHLQLIPDQSHMMVRVLQAVCIILKHSDIEHCACGLRLLSPHSVLGRS